MSLPQTPSGGNPRLRRGAVAASVVVVSIAALSACGAGNNAQTLEVKPDNAAASVGDLKVQNATVITQPKAGDPGPAVITARIFNNGTRSQTLDGVELAGSTSAVKLSPAKGHGPVTVPAQGSILIGGKNNPSAVIADGSAATKDGSAQRLVFNFSAAGQIPLNAYVVPASGYFTAYGPSALPATPKPKPSDSGKPAGSTTPGSSKTPGSSTASGSSTTPGSSTTSGSSTNPSGTESPAGASTATTGR